MRDIFKAISRIDYTKHDLRAPVHIHNRRKLENSIRRKTRRRLKADLSNAAKSM